MKKEVCEEKEPNFLKIFAVCAGVSFTVGLIIGLVTIIVNSEKMPETQDTV